MRPLVALALVLAACGGPDRNALPSAHETASIGSRFGADPLVLRLPRDGGVARVVAYPKLDSVLWRSSDAAPALARILAFDSDAGSIAFVDTHGIPGRIDLRLGGVHFATTRKAKLSDVASVDGSNIYAIGSDGALARFTPAGDWLFKPPEPGRAVFPQRDGSVLLLAGRGKEDVLWRLHPPDDRLLDTVHVPPPARELRTQLGDRIYLVDGHELVGVRTRTLDPVPAIDFDHDIRALTATPSGDRLFVATDDSHELSVVDRYRDKVATTLELPGQPEDLRMDALGRYLLVHAAGGDSAWVVDIGTARLIGTVTTAWRRDLPFVLPDGAVALAQDRDVVFVDGETLKPKQRAKGGTADFWYGFLWDGFRPRAKTLDQPVRFQSDSADSARAAAARDSMAADSAAKAGAVAPGTPSAPGTPATPAAPAPAAPTPVSPAVRGFTVSFAAVLSQQAAEQLASRIRVRGQTAHVVSTVRDGTTIYRVVLGPYATHAEADAVGRESRNSYWIFEGNP